jgi:hypothetical protein
MKTLLRFIALGILAAPLYAQTNAPLTVHRPDGSSVTLQASQLAALPRVRGFARAHGDSFTFEGSDLRHVLRTAGIAPVDSLSRSQLRRVVVFIGADDYSALIALSDLDATIGGRRAILVDREDGQALPPNRAPRRIIIEGDHRPTRWVRQLVRIDVVDLP